MMCAGGDPNGLSRKHLAHSFSTECACRNWPKPLPDDSKAIADVVNWKNVVTLPRFFEDIESNVTTVLQSARFEVSALSDAEIGKQDFVSNFVIHRRKGLPICAVPVEARRRHGLRLVGVRSQCLLIDSPHEFERAGVPYA